MNHKSYDIRYNQVSCKENYVRAKHISFEINKRITSSEALDVDFYNVDYKQRCSYLSSGF